jgi:glycine hydroxymethyltransferase
MQTHLYLQIAKDCASKTPAPAKLKEFKEYMATEGNARADIAALRQEVEALAAGFPMPGV